MSEITMSQLIKIIIGIFVVVAVLVGLGLIFKDKILSFFKNLPGSESAEVFLRLLI